MLAAASAAEMNAMMHGKSHECENASMSDADDGVGRHCPTKAVSTALMAMRPVQLDVCHHLNI